MRRADRTLALTQSIGPTGSVVHTLTTTNGAGLTANERQAARQLLGPDVVLTTIKGDGHAEIKGEALTEGHVMRVQVTNVKTCPHCAAAQTMTGIRGITR